MYFVVIILVVINVSTITAVQLDLLDCGVDHATEVPEGDVELYQYPWVGVLYYKYFGEVGESRSVTTVVLIHTEFVVGSAADIGPMPKTNFRRNSRVLLGEGWNRKGRRVRNYVLHPEYGATYSTVALVQLKDPVRDKTIKPLCPPPQMLRNPVFYVVKMKEDLDTLEKEVINVMHIPGKMCKEFYVAANLYSARLRPPHVACAVQPRARSVCVWPAGAALAARDVWGRWQFLGLGVRGPGCGAPARFLDMMSYYPWLQHTLQQFQRLTISKITNQKYVLRSGGENGSYQRFGACDPEEKVSLVYRESIALTTGHRAFQYLTYNMSIYDSVEFSCLTLELVDATGASEMKINHECHRESYGPACYSYKGSVFEIAVNLMFSDKCKFEMFAWGWVKEMEPLHIQYWKWEEGTYYEDFTMQRVEYRGQSYMTDFGYEPIDLGMWVPEYDIWTTTEFFNGTTPTTEFEGIMSTDPTTEPVGGWITKKKLRRKTTTTTLRPPLRRARPAPPAPAAVLAVKPAPPALPAPPAPAAVLAVKPAPPALPAPPAPAAVLAVKPAPPALPAPPAPAAVLAVKPAPPALPAPPAPAAVLAVKPAPPALPAPPAPAAVLAVKPAPPALPAPPAPAAVLAVKPAPPALPAPPAPAAVLAPKPAPPALPAPPAALPG